MSRGEDMDSWRGLTAEGPDPDLIAAAERDRIAGQLLDGIVRRVFAAGLALEGAAGLTREFEVRRKIEVAVGELDQVVREVREAVFSTGRHGARSDGGGQEIADWAGRLAGQARLRDRVHQVLAMIMEYATPTCVRISGDDGKQDVVIEAACLSPALVGGAPAGWLADVRARAARSGIGIDIQPESGSITASFQGSRQ